MNSSGRLGYMRALADRPRDAKALDFSMVDDEAGRRFRLLEEATRLGRLDLVIEASRGTRRAEVGEAEGAWAKLEGMMR